MTIEELEGLGIRCGAGSDRVNLATSKLIEDALKRDEGVLADNGSLCVTTGKYTGRSPKDRFVVDTPDVHDRIAWGGANAPFDPARYEAIKKRILDYLGACDPYVFKGFAGANRAHSRKFMVVAERASQALFVNQLLVRPTKEELASYGDPDFTVLAAPGMLCDPERDGTHSEAVVLINFQERCVLVAGTQYSGEIKKSVFSVMNYLMPTEDDVLPMHCSANLDPQTRQTAVFFGLSGTGKTTLSADPARRLIGDDEHGWGDDGVFNFEGGCYAKCIDLSLESEPDIYRAIRFGSECENVVLDSASRHPNYADDSLTENTRVGYPINFIDNAELSGKGNVPSVILFLTADAFGVLPPISRLSEEAAMYHFTVGFTSKVAGTERGITEPQPTFSALFGEPFMPLDPSVYARMLGERIERSHTRVYLVNTGWTGGSYGTGSRMKLRWTRAMISAALSGAIEEGSFRHDDTFNLDVPETCPGVPATVLNPRETWADGAAYDATAAKLASMFEENCERRHPTMDPKVRAAGPHPIKA